MQQAQNVIICEIFDWSKLAIEREMKKNAKN